MDRRHFLQQTALVGCGTVLGAVCPTMVAETKAAETNQANPANKLHVASNQYNWTTFYRRDGRDFMADLDAGFAEVARSGMDGFEPIGTSPQQVESLAALLKKHGLEMRSMYIGSTLHDAKEADKSIASVLAIAEQAKKSAGTQIIVTNVSPLSRIKAVPQDKTDAQLIFQAAALDRLGKTDSVCEYGTDASHRFQRA